MDRATRRERDRAAAKYVDHCAACKQPYATQTCAATYTGTRLGKWVTVCQDCHDKGRIDQIHGVGIYQSENTEAVARAQQALAPFLRQAERSGNLVRFTAEEQAELVAAFRQQNPDLQLMFPPALNS